MGNCEIDDSFVALLTHVYYLRHQKVSEAYRFLRKYFVQERNHRQPPSLHFFASLFKALHPISPSELTPLDEAVKIVLELYPKADPKAVKTLAMQSDSLSLSELGVKLSLISLK